MHVLSSYWKLAFWEHYYTFIIYMHRNIIQFKLNEFIYLIKINIKSSQLNNFSSSRLCEKETLGVQKV